MATITGKGFTPAVLKNFVDESVKQIANAKSLGAENDDAIKAFETNMVNGIAAYMLSEASTNVLKAMIENTYVTVTSGAGYNVMSDSSVGTKSNAYGKFIEQKFFGSEIGTGTRALKLPDIADIFLHVPGMLAEQVEIKAGQGSESPFRVGSVTVKGLPEGMHDWKLLKGDEKVQARVPYDKMRKDVGFIKMIQKMEHFLYFLIEQKMNSSDIRFEEITLFAELLLEKLVKSIYAKRMAFVQVEAGSKDYKPQPDGTYSQVYTIRLSQKKLDGGMLKIKDLYAIHRNILQELRSNDDLRARVYGQLRKTKMNVVPTQ